MPDAPRTYPGFPGKIGRTREDSVPHWIVPTRPPKGSPNVVIVFMDDMGWSDIGCYGSEIATPHIDALAARGIRLNNYSTHPICSPARAALLTGMNAHSVATGWLANNNPGFPGYSGEIPLDAPTMAETFKAAGYATAAVGKWHNAPNALIPNPSWPANRGFDQFYGFLEGETSYFSPARIVYNNVAAPIDEYPEGYYSTDDWTTKALGFITDIRNADPARPFFLYVANNAVHSPLQAKDSDLAKYRGRYDTGWDAIRAERFARQKTLGIVPPNAVLSERDPEVPAWDTLPEDQRALYARHMETYAAILDCADQNVGRLVARIELMGELDNTIIVFSSDNGGTSSGGPTGMTHFNRRFAGLPGLPVEVDVTRTEWIGTSRTPTLLDLAGVKPLEISHGKPAKPMHGSSLAPFLRDPAAPPSRTEQYYECWANRAYYRDGWIAVSLQVKGKPIDFDNWTLHLHAEDFSETIDLARQHPAKLAELVGAFDAAAWDNMVYPLDGRSPIQKFNELPPHQRPPLSSRRRFLPGAQTVHRGVMVPLIADRCFSFLVSFRHGDGDTGVLFAIGDVTGGILLYIEDGWLRLTYNGFGEFSEIEGPVVPTGERVAKLEYEALGKRRGRGRLVLDQGGASDWTDLNPTMLYGFHEGLDIGLDRRGPVSWALQKRHGTFRYGGTIHELVVESGPFAPDSGFGKG